MKLQDVILKTIAKKWTYFEAADIGGISVSRLAWVIEEYRRLGYTGIAQYRAGRMFRHRLPLEDLERILAMYPKQDTPSVFAFRRVLTRECGIQVEYEWLQAVLAGAGMIPTPLPRRRPPAALGRKARENRLEFPDFYPKAASASRTASRRSA
jgi:hypothetical protein